MRPKHPIYQWVIDNCEGMTADQIINAASERGHEISLKTVYRWMKIGGKEIARQNVDLSVLYGPELGAKVKARCVELLESLPAEDVRAEIMAEFNLTQAPALVTIKWWAQRARRYGKPKKLTNPRNIGDLKEYFDWYELPDILEAQGMPPQVALTRVMSAWTASEIQDRKAA